jgi:hypothetical protein
MFGRIEIINILNKNNKIYKRFSKSIENILCRLSKYYIRYKYS